MKTDHIFTTEAGNAISLSVYGPFGDRPCIIYAHGFKGYKDWGYIPYVGEYFARHGMTFIAFNFSHNGIGADMHSFTELDKFAKNTFSLEVEELMEIVEMCAHSDFLGAFLKKKIGLIGHSRGGGISILTARHEDDVTALATWSSVSSFDGLDKKTRARWRKDGYEAFRHVPSGTILKMGLDMLNDIERNARGRLNVSEAAANLKKPFLILHGEKDDVVPYYAAETLNIYADPAFTDMRLIPGANHVYDIEEPFDGTTPALERLLEETLAFFEGELRDGRMIEW